MEIAMQIIGSIILAILLYRIMTVMDHYDNYIQVRTLENILHAEKSKTEYSSSILKFIREYIANIAMLEFNEFRDSHDMEKITLANIRNLAKTVAEKSRHGLKLDSVNSVHLLYTGESLDAYIVKTSMEIVKGFTERTLDIVE